MSSNYVRNEAPKDLDRRCGVLGTGGRVIDFATARSVFTHMKVVLECLRELAQIVPSSAPAPPLGASKSACKPRGNFADVQKMVIEALPTLRSSPGHCVREETF